MLIEMVTNAMAASTRCRVVRLIHCLVVDGIFTHTHYRILVLSCSTRAANLVARTAICADERNADNQPLVIGGVRFARVHGRDRGTLARACGGQAPGAPLRTSPSRCCAVGWATRVVRPAVDSRQLMLACQRSTARVGALGRRCLGSADAGCSSGSAAAASGHSSGSAAAAGRSSGPAA